MEDTPFIHPGSAPGRHRPPSDTASASASSSTLTSSSHLASSSSTQPHPHPHPRPLSHPHPPPDLHSSPYPGPNPDPHSQPRAAKPHPLHHQILTATTASSLTASSILSASSSSSSSSSPSSLQHLSPVSHSTSLSSPSLVSPVTQLSPLSTTAGARPEAGPPSSFSSRISTSPTPTSTWPNHNLGHEHLKITNNPNSSPIQAQEVEEMDSDEPVQDNNDHDEDRGRPYHRNHRRDLSSPSLSLSMDEEDSCHQNTGNRTAKTLTRRGASSAASGAQKRTAGADSHSDSDSQFDSAMTSHPNSDSESDPDLESGPQSPRQAKKTSAPVPSKDLQRLGVRSAYRQGHDGDFQSRSVDTAHGHDHRYRDHDPTMDIDEGLDGLTMLAVAARQMPRREIVPRSGISIHEDSNASESEGSLALEGIDNARQWPSMSDTARSSKPKQGFSAEYNHLERKPMSTRDDQLQRSYRGMPSGTGLSMTSAPISMPMPRASRVRDSITKDSVPRKWICRQVLVKTLGGEMMTPLWFTEEEMHLNEPVVLAEMDTDRMDHDLMRPHSYPGYYPHNNHHQHHHHHHHHHLMAEDPLQAHTARQKRKMKLKDMALRESRDPQDLMESPEPMDNKRRHIESHSKEFKGKHPVKDYAPGDKRLKVNRDSGDPMNARREKKNSMRKVPRERSESHISTTRDSTPTTPVDGTMSDHGTPPPRQRRPIEGNSNNSNNMPGASPSSGNRPRPFVCNIEDCGKRFVDALQLERHIDRHRPKELECDLDMCGKLFSDIMLLRRHQSMVHKRRSEKWESPPGTTRQRSGRSRRREPRIVASGDVIDPAVLERQPRGSQEVDHSADDYGEEDSGRDDDDATPTATLSIKKEKELKPSLVKTPKEPKEFKGPRTFKQPKIKSPKEHQPPQGYIPKKLAPKAGDDGTGAGDMDVDASEVTRLSPQRAQGPSEDAQSKASASAGSRPRPFHCTYDDCKKVFIDAIQLERHLERHGPKELECGIDGCRKRFSAQMLLRRHQSMVHKRRSPAVPISSKTGANYHKAAAAAVASGPLDPSRRSTPAPPALASTLHSHPTQEEERASTSTSASPYGESRQAQTSFLSETENRYELDED